jgi:malonyl CoA-acyl carrier protein transacylase
MWEIGPGKVLKGLINRISRTLQVDSFGSLQDFAKLSPTERA